MSLSVESTPSIMIICREPAAKIITQAASRVPTQRPLPPSFIGSDGSSRRQDRNQWEDSGPLWRADNGCDIVAAAKMSARAIVKKHLTNDVR